MNLNGTTTKAAKTGRKRTKGKPILLKIRKDLREYLQKESDKRGKPMVLIVEELLEFRRQFKQWPPIQAS